MDSPHTVEYRAFLVQLRAARKHAKMTQQEVADRLGVSQSRVARMESGERRVDVIELARFAKVYRKRLSYFVKV